MIELKNINVLINTMTNKKLTVIIPIRENKDRDILKRLQYSLEDNYLDYKRVNFLVVDDGSSREFLDDLYNICVLNSSSLIHLDTRLEPFSIARARNIGVMYAQSIYIMFLDVDLVTYNGFYNDILSEIKIQQLYQYSDDFIMVGVIYLTKEASIEYFDINKKIRKNFVIQKLLENDESFIEKFSTGTSVCLYNRKVYLAHGGNDEDFKEWGYDDLEFNTRMIRASHKFSLPKNFMLDYKNFRTINEYKGWKSIYRLYGDITFQKGIILTHIWHDVNMQSDYMQGKAVNKKLFEEKFKLYKETEIEPSVLPCIYSGKTLIFTETNPFICSRKILSLLGEVIYLDENKSNLDSILKLIISENIDRILMFNPYATERRLELFNSLKNNKSISIIVVERGALPDSIFYDFNGFNADSSSYDIKNWDHDLDNLSLSKVKNYIRNTRTSNSFLEKQNIRLGSTVVRKKLSISLNKKILFVPMQRPSDSVIKYFCGDILSYDNFVQLVQDTVDRLSDEWVVVVTVLQV